MIRHIIAWNYAPGFTAEQNAANAREVKHRLEQLCVSITAITELKVILDPLASADADIILTSLFADEAALAEYQKHPLHQQAGAFVNTVMCNRRCIDYWE